MQSYWTVGARGPGACPDFARSDINYDVSVEGGGGGGVKNCHFYEVKENKEGERVKNYRF